MTCSLDLVCLFTVDAALLCFWDLGFAVFTVVLVVDDTIIVLFCYCCCWIADTRAAYPLCSLNGSVALAIQPLYLGFYPSPSH